MQCLVLLLAYAYVLQRMANRDWMYTGFARKDEDWVRGTSNFLDQAFGPAARGSIRMPCPCRSCKNSKRKIKDEIWKDLYRNGYVEDYKTWIFHGEKARIREEVRAELEKFDGDAGVDDMIVDFNEARGNERLVEEDPEETAKAFYEMMESAKKPLHKYTTLSQLECMGRLMGLKSQLNMSREGFNLMLQIFGEMLPEGHELPKNEYTSQKLLRALKMDYESIHACPNGCVLFRGEDLESATHCPKCKASRFVEVERSDGMKKQSPIPEKVLRYLPVIPRLQRLYMTEESAKQMRWHKNGKRYSGNMVHPSDGDAWKYFDAQHPRKAEEARNVRVAFATDGFNPYGMMAAPYTCWPVFVIPLNLPPGVMFDPKNVFLSLIIPGHPGNNMGVFMQPLWDELLRAWEKGVCTYDQASKRNFIMHVWYQYSLHDFLAYGIFSGWCVHGKFPCPTCKATVMFTWLKKGGKYSSFDKHRQFLDDNHEFRRDTKHFTKGVEVTDPKPEIMSGAQILAQLEALEIDPDNGGFKGYGETHMWTHVSGLHRLPYFKDLLLPHNIDVMHTEKNVAEALWATIMDIKEKSKDNVKARLDVEEICDRPKYVMKTPVEGKNWRRGPADYIIKRSDRKKVLEWIKTLMFPDGYAANLSRGVNLKTMKVLGMKSHDFHIWIERLLPAMTRGYLPEPVWRVLAELSYFFRQLCAREISREVILELEHAAPQLICKLEMIFPPGFFLPMQHLILHLPREALLGGPVWARWCYTIERCLKTLRKKCKNKAKIEASVAEAFRVEEVSNFTKAYYAENTTPRYNEEWSLSTLSLFKGQLGRGSTATCKTLQQHEFHTIMMYVLLNLDEVVPYRT